MTFAILDHLWQSTLLALALGLLTLVFRKAPAAVRYGLWFAASAKFLVPFAALAALGRFLAPAIRLPASAAPDAAILKQAAAPFSQSPLAQSVLAQPVVSPVAIPHAAPPLLAAHAVPHLDLMALIPLALFAVWALGSAVIAAAWAVRWTRLRRVVRSARPLAWPAPMPILAASSLVEPGLVGLWRPVLLVPETLPDHLGQVEIAAIVAHEACHLRRRDNVTAAIHMLVEALFWFHPLVWWTGARMIAERERACDEAVVAAGHDRAAYARSLVESCRLYLQSPLDCVAGASGSNLKTRVEMIMTAPLCSPLSLSKKALLAAAGALAFATPVTAGLITTPEGQQAVARASAVASNLMGGRIGSAPAVQAAAPEAEPVVTLSRQKPLAPNLVVAALDAAPVALARDPAAPQIDAAPAPQPVQVASAADTPPRASAAPTPAPKLSTDPAEIRRQSAEFVRSYAAMTATHVAGRWMNDICVGVIGLQLQAGAKVKARVEQVARSLDVAVQRGDCNYKGVDHTNVEVVFTSDPQGALDQAIKNHRTVLGDLTTGTQDIKTVTLPIQAWYRSNQSQIAANDSGSLMAPADWRGDQRDLKILVQQGPVFTPGGTGSTTVFQNGGNNNGNGNFRGGFGQPYNGGFAGGAARRSFYNVLIIVDLRRTGAANAGPIADYAAMLALSQPRALGQCNVLPSVTDLFATCPGRAAPDGLTPADAAYLTALYGRDVLGGRQKATDADIAKRMGEILAKSGARAEAEPARPIKPAVFDAAPARLTLTPVSLTTGRPDLKGEAESFVKAASFSTNRWTIGRWQNPICVRVAGLAPEQARAVRARVEGLAREIGIGAQGAGCQRPDVEIGFTNDPQRMLAAAVGDNADNLGDPTSESWGVKTVIRPIQAWRRTNGYDGSPTPGGNVPGVQARVLLNAMIIVDLRRTGGRSLGN